jgi:hypothetical protein
LAYLRPRSCRAQPAAVDVSHVEPVELEAERLAELMHLAADRGELFGRELLGFLAVEPRRSVLALEVLDEL